MARGTRTKGLQKARRKTSSKTKSQSQIALEKEYKRLRKNLQQKVRYYRKKGMLLYDDIIPDIPKKITLSSIKRLQKIDVRKRALKGEHIDLETGEIIGAKIKTPNIPIQQPYYPTISVIDTIRQRLNGLELQTKGYDPSFESMKNTLINIFEENVSYNEDNLGELIDYYDENLDEILSEIDRVATYRSKEDARDREQSFATLARLLNGGSLSRLQAESVSNFGEYFSS